MQNLVLYLDIDEKGADEKELRRALSKLEDVSAVSVEKEEAERGALELISSFTVIITAAGGAVMASTVLLDRVRALLVSVRGVRQAWVETAQGPQPMDTAKSDQGAKKKSPRGPKKAKSGQGPK